MSAIAPMLALLLLAQTTTLPGGADVAAAFDAARARADAGDAVAQYSIGALLYSATDDTAAALAWIRRAAGQHHAGAEFQLGQIHEFGFGVGADAAQAIVWYRRAAEDGSAAGQRAMGECYAKGHGVAADPAEAARWYRRAADAGDLRAQYALGQLYFDGTGVARDYASAYVWFALAAAQTPLVDNRKGLLELRNIAAARMTPEQVADAARRVAAWTPAPSR